MFRTSTQAWYMQHRHIAAGVCCADQHTDSAPCRQRPHRQHTKGVLQRIGLWLQLVPVPFSKQPERAAASNYNQLPIVPSADDPAGIVQWGSWEWLRARSGAHASGLWCALLPSGINNPGT